MPYSRPQIKLLLLFALTLLAGLGVREWRAGFPDLAERLERFDREEVAPPPAQTPPERRRSSAARTAARPRGADSSPADAGFPEPGVAPPDRARPAPGVDAAPADRRPLDINTASLGELARLPGVGQSLAGRILAERERRGGFDSPEALRYVLGMGPKKLAAIRELVTVASVSPAAAEAPPDPPGAP